MYRFSLKKKRRRSRSIAPGGLVFLVVLLIYTFSGAGTDHAESPSPPEENTSSVSSEETLIVFGRPVTRLRPLTSI